MTITAYAVIWLLTYFVGGSQVRRFTLAELQIGPSYHQVPLETEHLSSFPVYGYRVVSYAPFILTARCMAWRDGESAHGGTAIYLWLGVPSRPIRIYEWAV
jgi:hypothetical protein